MPPATTERYGWRFAKAFGLILLGISAHLWIDDPRLDWIGRAELAWVDIRPPTVPHQPVLVTRAAVVPRHVIDSREDGPMIQLAAATDATPPGDAGVIGTSGTAVLHPGHEGVAMSGPSHDGLEPASRSLAVVSHVVRTGGLLPSPDAAIPPLRSPRLSAEWAGDLEALAPVPAPEFTTVALSRTASEAPAPDRRLPATDLTSDRAATAPMSVPPDQEEDSILQVLREYETAVGRKDPLAAKAVWPSLDDRALARAFNDLEAHSLALDECGVSVAKSAARVRCHGVATYLPKVGRRKAIHSSHEWTFNLSKSGGDWQIESAAIR